VKRIVSFAAAGLLAVSALGAVAAARSRASDLQLQQVANATSPVYAAAPRSEPKKIYIVEQAGVVRVLSAGRLQKAPFLDIHSRVRSGGEQGLLSIAFDPGYARNHLFYVDYTDLNGNTRVVRFRSSGRKAVLSSAKQLLFVRQPYANHNGGQLQFGPDGKLYVGMGDGGSGGDPQNRAQNLSSRLGKLLVLDVRKPSARWRIAGYGLRNPWRFSFDRQSGDLVIGDVGQDSWEEIDFLARTGLALPPENYGWSVYEGTHSFKNEPLTSVGKLVMPIYEYAHGTSDANCSVTGGYVYRGKALPGLRGRYLFGDYCSGEIWSLVVSGGQATDVRKEPISVPSLSSFGEDANGELYAVSLNGPVYRIR